MAEINPAPDVANLLAMLDERRGTGPRSKAFSLEDLASMAMSDEFDEEYEVVQARFTGALPTAHAIGLREAASILGSFQDVVSEVGAALREESPKRGPLPASILAETALHLSPAVKPGSVIFSMTPARDEALFAASTLLADTLSEVFALFDQVEKPVSEQGTPDTVSEALRRFGPRTARHLVRFAGALNTHGLHVDLGIARSGGQLLGSRLSTGGAKFLESLAERATKRTSEVVIEGEVKNLDRDDKYRIAAGDRGTIPVRGTSEITDVLQEAFRHARVRMVLIETETANAATGAVVSTFQAVSAEVVAD